MITGEELKKFAASIDEKEIEALWHNSPERTRPTKIEGRSIMLTAMLAAAKFQQDREREKILEKFRVLLYRYGFESKQDEKLIREYLDNWVREWKG